MQLSDMQQEFLQSCGHLWNVKTGATGSGKTFLDYSVVIPKRILACRGDGLIFLIGHTIGTLERNVLAPMRELWGSDLVGNVKTGSSGAHVKLFGKDCMVMGADKQSQVARIQGATIEYAYGDEVTTWSEPVFQMLKSRLRCDNSHCDMTCNPTDPYHWFKKFLDSDADCYHQAYTIDDNPFLPPAFVDELKKEYSGTVYYNRYILGQWMSAEGLVYPIFADDPKRFIADPAQRYMKVVIGVDFGGNGSKHSFVCCGITSSREVVGLASQRTEPGDVDRLAREFLLFCETMFTRFGEITAVYCDSAEQVIIRQLRAETKKHQRLSWLSGRIHNSKKIEIVDRIRLTSILMGSGRFWITKEAASLSEALATALWSEKHAGKDERLDDGTTDIDSLDAFEYCFEREKEFLLNGRG